MTNWIRTSERTPEDGVPVLILSKKNQIYEATRLMDKAAYWVDYNLQKCEVPAYWVPKPKLPENRSQV